MTYIIPNPESRKHSQTNRNDVSGTIVSSKNINLDEEAYIKLSPGSFAVMTTDDDADFDTADAINIGDGKVFINSDEVFSGDISFNALSNLSSDTNSPSPGPEDDNIFFNDTQVVSDGTTVRYLSASSTWTNITGLTIADSHPTCLAVFDGQNGLMIGHGNRVDLVDTSWALDQTLILPNEYKVSSMTSNGSVAYIGTRHDASGEAKMFIWDGAGASASQSYGIETFEIAALRPANSSVIAFSSDGRLLRFNGGGFDELATLPVYITEEIYGDETNDYSKVTNRGMVVDGNQVFVFAPSVLETAQRYLVNMSGGIWCFDPNVGYYHRYSPSLSPSTDETITTGNVDIATNEFTVATAPKTGTPVFYDGASGDLIAELREVTPYFAIKVDATTIKLAASEADALAGTAIDISTTGNNAQDFIYIETFDYGQQFLDNRASVAVIGNSMRNSNYAGRVICTAEARDEVLGQKTTLSTYNQNLPNRGYVVLPRLYSSDKDDKFQAINIKHGDLSTHDSIVVKYRTSTPHQYPIDVRNDISGNLGDVAGTWTSTTTFTTTHDISQAQVGDEVELIAGAGSGFMAHIQSISVDAGTYTVTLDEAYIFATTNDKFMFVIDNWRKLGTITADSLNDSLRIDSVGQYLQIKIELRGIETKILDVMINNRSYRSLI